MKIPREVEKFMTYAFFQVLIFPLTFFGSFSRFVAFIQFFNVLVCRLFPVCVHFLANAFYIGSHRLSDKATASLLWVSSVILEISVQFHLAFLRSCIILTACRTQAPVRSRSILAPAEICDLLKGFILVSCSMLMFYIDTSMMYHLIKSQSVIKLYIFYNMLEVQYVIYIFYV